MASPVYTRTENINGDGNVPRNPVHFYIEPVRLAFESEKQGREIWEDREFIKIFLPGDAKTVHNREATDDDRAKYAEAYARWKKTGEMATEGTPLEQWPYVGPAQIRMLKAQNIFSVENLANLSDTAMQNIGPGGRDLTLKAKAFLETAANSADAQRYVTENEEMKSEMEMLKGQIADLGQQLAEAQTKRGPGRPPKNQPQGDAA